LKSDHCLYFQGNLSETVDEAPPAPEFENGCRNAPRELIAEAGAFFRCRLVEHLENRDTWIAARP